MLVSVTPDVEYDDGCIARKMALALFFATFLISTTFAMPPSQPLLINSLKAGPKKTLVITTNGGLYISGNEGNDWVPFKPPYLPWTVEAKGGGETYTTKPVDSSKSTQDFLSWWIPAPGPLASDARGGRYSCVGETIFKSADEGMQWKAISSVPRPQGAPPPNLCVTLLGVGNTLYAGTLHGIYKSTDSGVKWESTADTQVLREAAVDLILADSDGNLYLNARSTKIGNGKATYKSTNGGKQWSVVNFGTRPASENYVPKVVGIANQMVYASSFAGLIASANEGESWATMNSGLKTQSKDESIPWDVVSSIQKGPSGALYATTPRQLYRLPLNSNTWLALERNGIPSFPGQ